jgi:hypothetical protein
VIRLMTITYGTSMPRAGAVHLIKIHRSTAEAPTADLPPTADVPGNAVIR